jgi:hypothetical protein
MLSFPPAVHLWLATAPTDLRKSFDTLAEVVRQHLHHDPLSGHVFVFRNKDNVRKVSRAGRFCRLKGDNRFCRATSIQRRRRGDFAGSSRATGSADGAGRQGSR